MAAVALDLPILSSNELEQFFSSLSSFEDEASFFAGSFQPSTNLFVNSSSLGLLDTLDSASPLNQVCKPVMPAYHKQAAPLEFPPYADVTSDCSSSLPVLPLDFSADSLFTQDSPCPVPQTVSPYAHSSAVGYSPLAALQPVVPSASYRSSSSCSNSSASSTCSSSNHSTPRASPKTKASKNMKKNRPLSKSRRKILQKEMRAATVEAQFADLEKEQFALKSQMSTLISQIMSSSRLRGKIFVD